MKTTYIKLAGNTELIGLIGDYTDKIKGAMDESERKKCNIIIDFMTDDGKGRFVCNSDDLIYTLCVEEETPDNDEDE